MHYRIVATLGPSSDCPAVWSAMLTAGIDAFRLNTSHLTHESLSVWLEKLDPFLRPLQPRPPLILDLQGSKWRLGQFEPFELMPGDRIDLIAAENCTRIATLPIPHPDFFLAAPHSSERIALNDARSILVVEAIESNAIRTRVMRGGLVLPRKGITFIESDYRQEKLGEQDHRFVEMTRPFAGIRYAISYVRDAAEMQHYRELLGRDLYLIAKLERKSAVTQARQLADSADELWLCRGDLGAELGFRALAETARRFAAQVPSLPLPVLLAGQVLEHLSEHSTPTRAELCNLYDSLCSGYHGVVLSDETAVGQYPIESCRIAALFRDSSGAETNRNILA